MTIRGTRRDHDIVWQPSGQRIAEAEITRFAASLSARTGRSVTASDDVAALALDDPEAFWSTLWDHFGVVGDKGYAPFVTGDDMLSTRFFPDARLNFAENLLGTGEKRYPDGPALVIWGRIPRTKSGKISELAVRDVVHGRAVKRIDSLENPEALDCFRDLSGLRL